jgi:hypothetical protein
MAHPKPQPLAGVLAVALVLGATGCPSGASSGSDGGADWPLDAGTGDEADAGLSGGDPPGSSIQLAPAIASLGPGQSLALSAAVLGPLAGSLIDWVAEGSASVSPSGIVSQPEQGSLGESVITACIGAGPTRVCDSASILPGYSVSVLGRFCDRLNPCPDPFECSSFAASPSGTGACSLRCLTTAGCAYGYHNAGEPFCPPGGTPRHCAVSCAIALACPGSMSCLDTTDDDVPDTCVDFGQTGWPPRGVGSPCQDDGQCTFPSLACSSTQGSCQPVTCPDGVASGQRCTVSQVGDGVCTPQVGQRSLCVLEGSSTGDCAVVSTRSELESRCQAGWLCVPTDGAHGRCQLACQGSNDCEGSSVDCVVSFPRIPALQTCAVRAAPHLTCAGSASLSLDFVYSEPLGHWGQRARGGELADLDGDGRLELLLPVRGKDGGLEVIGAFPSGRALDVQRRAPSPNLDLIRVGDVDGDGVKELIGFDSSHAFVLKAQPAGNLVITQTVALAPGVELAAVGDVTGDSLADLLAVSSTSDELVLRAATAGGGFSTASTLALADGGAGHLLVEDCDGDGVQDVISIGPALVSVWRGSPSGLGTRSDQPHGLGDTLAQQVLADFDGDGRTDLGALVRGGGPPELRVLTAQPSCAFSLTSRGVSVDPLADGRPVAVLDTDADGQADLLVAGRDVGLAQFRGTASGFALTAEALLPDVQTDSSGGALLRPPGLAFFGAGEFDSVPGAELVRVIGSTVEVLPLTLPDRPAHAMGDAFRVGPVVGSADLNGDMVPDVVGTLGLTLSQPDGGWVDSVDLFSTPPLADGGSTWALRALGDLDGDGEVDLLAEVDCGRPGARVALAHGTHAGTFSERSATTCSGPGAFRALLDWDGANGPDVLCEGPQGLFPFLNDGAGNFQADFPLGLASPWPGAVGDFDGDQRDDVAFQDGASPTLAVVFADHSVAVELPADSTLALTPAGPCGPRPVLLAVDLDQDGAQELVGVVTGQWGDLLFIWRARAETFEWRRLPFRSGQGSSLSAGDLDQDGTVDLVVGTAPPASLQWSAPSALLYQSDGAAGVGPPRGLGVDTFDSGAALVDLDRDGRVDLLLPRGPGPWSATAWPNRCP